MTATKRQSRPARIADEIEAADRGWTVERRKSGPERTVYATREGETVTFVFTRYASGRDVLLRASSWTTDGPVEISNVAAKVREMTAPPDRPFALDDLDETVLAAVAGRRVEWTHRITGKIEEADVPRASVHLTLKHPTVPGYASGERVLSFADAAGGGFRSVRLDQIRKVT